MSKGTGSGKPGQPTRRVRRRRRKRKLSGKALVASENKDAEIKFRVRSSLKNGAHTIAERRGTTVTAILTKHLEELIAEELKKTEKQF